MVPIGKTGMRLTRFLSPILRGNVFHKRILFVCMCASVRNACRQRRTEEVTFISYIFVCAHTVVWYIKSHFEDEKNETQRKLNNKEWLRWWRDTERGVRGWKDGMCLPLSASKEAREKRQPVRNRNNKTNPLYQPPTVGHSSTDTLHKCKINLEWTTHF